MKVGLVRHFPVAMGLPGSKVKLITPKEINQWLDDYDASDIIAGEVDLGSTLWEKCFCSSATRAVKTAEKIYPGQITVMGELREIRLYPFFSRNIKLPFFMWFLLVRLAWLISHKSQLESKDDLDKRINLVLDEVIAGPEENVLIVGHAALMMLMRKELLRRGFSGPDFYQPANAKLYVFEK